MRPARRLPLRRGAHPRPVAACALLLLATACSRGEVADTGWDPLGGDAWQVERGTVDVLRDSYLTRWYGQESP